jgi:hypothetical protein
MERPSLDLSGYDPEYRFSRKEVAQITGFSLRTIVRAADERLLQEVRIPSLRGTRSIPRYTRDAIKAFVNSGYIKPRSRRSLIH